jgi:hypothetical protein
MTTKVLTQEEITKLNDLQKTQSKLIEDFGVVGYQMQILENKKQELKAELIKHQQAENQLGQELQTKYGDGSIDLEKGEFVSAT